MLALEDFEDDAPWQDDPAVFSEVTIEDQIEGVVMQRLVRKADKRGNLTVLMSEIYGADMHTPHVYLVTAAAGSVRAWVYHKRQSDRLAYTMGSLRIVLYDLRPESPTYGKLNVIDAGENNRILLTIPPFVVHGVQNRGDRDVQFVNMPTRAYDPARPDKSRISAAHPGIPYVFD